MRKTLGFMFAMMILFASTALAAPLEMTGYDTETVTRSWETNEFFSRMQTLTGIEVSAHAITEEKEYLSMLSKMMTGEQQADVLFKANLNREQEKGLLDSGAILDLAPYIESEMPNFSAMLKEHPEWLEQIALEDGRIASLPFINMHERQVCVWLNATWLETMGIAFPDSLETLTEALQAMAERDPNANGKKDEVPVDLIGVYEMRWFLPFFGIVADDYNVCRTADGTLAFAPDQAEYRVFVETLKHWYDLGLMRSDAFTASHTTQQITANANNSGNSQKTVNTSGMLVTITPYTHVDADEVLNYRAVLLPGPDGTVRWRDFLGELWTGTFAVTSRCQDPGAALRWADALYGEAGASLAYVGVEGEEYHWKENGYWEYILQDDDAIEEIRAKKIIYTGTSIPGLYPDWIIEAVDSPVDRLVFEESEKVHAVSERVLNNYFLPDAISDEVGELSTRLGEMVDSGLARFITGEIPLDDANWNTWITSLHEAGSERLLQLLAF